MKVALRVERLAKSGDGLAHHEGRAVFVAGALPGETVEVELVTRGKVLRGEQAAIVTPSPDRRAPACPLFGRCGGCDWLHTTEVVQRREKEQIVVSALEHVGRIAPSDYQLRSTLGPEPFLGARRRAVLHVEHGKLGFFEHESHALVEVGACPALTPRLQAVLPTLSELKPLLRELSEVHLLEASGAVAAALWLKGPRRPAHEDRAERWRRAAGLAGVVLVPDDGPSQLIGAPELRDGATFVRPDAFAQAHVTGNRLLVDTALGVLGDGAESALELYCGNGNFTVPLAAKVPRVVAVESSPVSLALARKVLGPQVRLMQQDAERAVQGLVAARERFDVLLADPPRTGAPGIAGWATELMVKRVIYVACDPASLARDAGQLVGQGFRPVSLQLLDLFPQTHHIEAVMAFERR
ncbi:MAG: methyltransferase domain-containing protein [Myxococcaceae bacterium]|nr:methyltransferase domain-containing protein [Myxococcaceae bacterium]